MSDIISSINPLQDMNGTSFLSPAHISKENAAAEFSSIFLQQMLKQVFKDPGSELFGSDDMSPSYSGIFTQQIIRQLAEEDAFGFNKIISETVARRAPVNSNTEGIF